MGKNVTVHILSLLLVILTVFILTSIYKLNYFFLQFTAILLIFLIISRRLVTKNAFKLVESIVSTACVLMITSSTGGATSPFFFLNDFLLFELSILLEPVIPLVLSAGLAVFYIYTHGSELPFVSLVPLASLPLMTPLAYYTGLIYQKMKNQKKLIRSLEKKVEDLEEEIVEEELEKAIIS